MRGYCTLRKLLLQRKLSPYPNNFETPCANNAVFLNLFHAGAGPGAGTGPDANQGADSLRNSKSCLSMELALRLGHFVWRLFCSLLLCCHA
jgi:hypothetical protein